MNTLQAVASALGITIVEARRKRIYDEAGLLAECKAECKRREWDYSITNEGPEPRDIYATIYGRGFGRGEEAFGRGCSEAEAFFAAFLNAVAASEVKA